MTVDRLLRAISRGPVALALVLVVSLGVLLPGLASSGLWEPQELAIADKVVARLDRERKAPDPTDGKDAAKKPDAPKVPGEESGPCKKQVPADAVARTFTERAAAWGMATLEESDRGMRLPLALLGVLTVLAIAGTAHRVAGGRAALLAGLVALSFPLLVLQARQLTSELGTPAGGAIMLWGLCALGERRGLWGVIESVVAAVAIALGAGIAFVAGGALLGLVVPLGAFAAAGGLGAPRVVVLWRAARRPRGTAMAGDAPEPGALPRAIKHGLATVATVALLGGLAYQLYDLRPPVPGTRSILGHSVIPSDCYSPALGGIWRFDDDLRAPFDSSVEQIGYGTMPWGVLAPLAVIGLLASVDRRRRFVGGVTLAWAAGAWIATEAFQRKVGFTIYAGFPAIALAVGVWLDGAIGRARGERADDPAADGTAGRAALVVALYVAIAAFILGKDLLGFADHQASLLVGQELIKYPKVATLWLVPVKVWALVLAIVTGGGFAVALALGRGEAPARARKVARIAAVVAALATVAGARFWAEGWQATLGASLSSKQIFATYRELRHDGDVLAIMGDLGNAPRYYAHTKWETLAGRDALLAAMARKERVFALAPAAELCAIHREAAGRPYFVLDDTNSRTLLLSNKVDGTTDKNPLATAVLRAEPAGIKQRPKGRIVYDNKIELIGWDIPTTVNRGERFEVKLFYKILAPVGGAWRGFMHFDGPGGRFNGDHDPINNRCPTSYWQQGDFIVDAFPVEGANRAFSRGSYEVWSGFFTGTNPNWRNLPVSAAPGDQRDNADRVKLTTITVD